MNQKQTDITTGKQIRHLRTQSGMTQEELAGKLNVTRQALSNWERDVNEPDLNTLKKICFLFGVRTVPLSPRRGYLPSLENCLKIWICRISAFTIYAIRRLRICTN